MNYFIKNNMLASPKFSVLSHAKGCTRVLLLNEKYTDSYIQNQNGY